MTNMELAYRKAEIAKAVEECPPGMHTNSNLAWGLWMKLVRDLEAEGCSREVAFDLATGCR